MKTKYKKTAIFAFLIFALAHCGTPTRTTPSTPKSTQTSKKASSMKGYASWYGGKFHGRKTASGQVYDQEKMTAAHKSLPFGTKVTVTNLSNQKQTHVVINDRGPFVEGRVIDLSRAAAREIGMLNTGTAMVQLSVDGPTDFEAKTFFIQVGSYRDQENAQMQQRDIASALPRISVQIIENKGYFRVHVGPYATRDDANNALSSLKRKNFDGIVLQL